ncbi:AAA family ATPase [Streptomyces griseosporeus]|uniref:AAA family ATPase n=1 Tax=Streptomyces griseosporeus TaxID=1910 RepID=UPI00368E646B
MTAHALVVGAGGFPQPSSGEEDRAAGRIVLRPLPSVAEAVPEVARALDAAGVRVADLLLDPTLREWEDAWRRVRDEAGKEPVIVHFGGHGLVVDTDLYLAVSDTDPRPGFVHGSAVDVALLLRTVDRGPGGPVLFLLDVCGAGAALRPQLVAKLAGVRNRKAWVIAACPAEEITYGARFSTAVAAVLEDLAKRRVFVGSALRYVPVEQLAARIDQVMARADAARGEPKQEVVRTADDAAVLPPPPFLANPYYRSRASDAYLAHLDGGLEHFAQALDPRFDIVHFAGRAAGGAGGAGLFRFSGRRRQLARLREWLDGPAGTEDRLLVVTGSPGAGKSALLGVAVCSVHPELEGLRARLGLETFRPRPDPRLLAVHARQLTTRQVVGSLHRQILAAVAAPAADGTPDEPERAVATGELLDTLARAGGATVVVDALDEADDPEELLREVLLPLAGRPDPGTAPGCRVLLGTRLWPDALRDLRAVLEGRPALRIDLDDERPQVLADDLGVYLEKLLDPHYPAQTARELAARLAHSAEHGAFLTAFLYGTHLRARHAAGDPPGPEEAVAGLPLDLPGMLDLNLRTLRAEDPWTGPVLAAVGRAAGSGMPLELVHAVALALAPAARGPLPAPRPDDTRAALDHARFYLRRTADGDRPVYRFFHQALAERMAPLAPPGVVLRALLERVPVVDGVRDWSAADPYLRRHAADHAAEAGAETLDALLSDTGHLLHAEPERLAPHLHRARGARARRHADVYRQTAAHHPLRHSLTARRDLLALEAAVWQDADLAAALGAATGPPPPLVRPHWALSRTAAAARLHTLGPHTGPVHRVLLTDASGDDAGGATSGGPEGRARTEGVARATSGGPEGRARTEGVARATSGGPEGRARTDGVARATSGGPEGRAQTEDEADATSGGPESRAQTEDEADATSGGPEGRARTDGVARAASGGTAGPVHVGDTGGVTAAADARARAGEPIAATIGADRPARTGSQTVVTAGADGRVRRWDPLRGGARGDLDGIGGPVRAADTVRDRDGRALLVCLGGARLTVHDLGTGALRHSLPLSDDPPPHLLTALTLADGSARAVTAGDGRTVRVWDLDAGRPLCTRDAPMTVVRALVAGTLPDGRAVMLAAGDEYLAMVWDLRTGRRLHRLGPHGDFVRAAALARRTDGGAVAVTGGADARLHVWDLSDGHALHTLSGHRDWITALAAGRAGGRCLAVSGDRQGRLLVWDLDTGRPVRELPGRQGVITCVALFGDVGAGLAVAGCADGRVAVWDLGTGVRTHGFAAHPFGVHDLAVGRVEDRLVVLSGGGDGRAVVWDVTPGEAGGETAPDGVSAAGDTRAGAAGGDGTALGWGGPSTAVALCVPRTGPALLLSADARTLEAREFTTGRRRFRLALPAPVPWGRTVAAAEVRDLGPVAVTAGRDGVVRTWNLTTGALACSFAGPSRRIRTPAVTSLPGGRAVLVAGEDDGTATVRDLTTGELLAVFPGHAGRLRTLTTLDLPGAPPAAVSADDSGAVLVWNLLSGEPITALARTGPPVHAVAAAVLPGGRAVVVAGGEAGEVRRWDLSAPGAAEHLTGLERRVNALATARLANGTVVAAGGGEDGRLAFWDLAARTELRPSYHLPGAVTALAACPEGVAVAHAAGTAALGWTAGRPA